MNITRTVLANIANSTKPVGCAKVEKSTKSVNQAVSERCNTLDEFVELKDRLKTHRQRDELPAIRVLKEVLSEIQKRELEQWKYDADTPQQHKFTLEAPWLTQPTAQARGWVSTVTDPDRNSSDSTKE